MILIILLFTITNFKIAATKSGTSRLTVPDQYKTIQEAINAANSGDTIYVKAGIYNENITINKAISLIGEKPENTIINGTCPGIRITVIADNVRIQGFTIQNGESGIFLRKSSGHKIINNIVKLNNEGIYLQYSHNTTIYKNQILENVLSGICLWESTNNLIIGNQIIGGKGFGIDFWTKQGNNKILGNTIKDNQWDGIYMSESHNNMIFRNNIINDTVQTYKSYNNTWNNEAEGNYWSVYQNEDNNGDGIGDTPHYITANDADYHPLIHFYNLGDINHDGVVNYTDINLLRQFFGARVEDARWNPCADLNVDGVINVRDTIILVLNLKQCS
jgi:parallel beta-helix repeat protein